MMNQDASLKVVVMIIWFLLVSVSGLDGALSAEGLHPARREIGSGLVASPQEPNETGDEDGGAGSQVNLDEKRKIEGVIVMRETDRFRLRDYSGRDIVVRFTDSTDIREKKSNPFRKAKRYHADQLMRGLNVVVEGRGQSSGDVLAESIRFTQSQLKLAKTLRSRVAPVEKRLGDTEHRLSQAERNGERLSGQVDELVEISNLARGGAKAAQETADAAVRGVTRLNGRISTLDDYEVVQDLVIQFKAGSARLLPEAKTQLDRMATAAKGWKGFFIEVVGFASADGDEAFNRRLSQRRAQGVVRYLVENHDIPLRRLLMPFGYGEAHPVADNRTQNGRQLNRRAEVKLLVNQGLRLDSDGYESNQERTNRERTGTSSLPMRSGRESMLGAFGEAFISDPRLATGG